MKVVLNTINNNFNKTTFGTTTKKDSADSKYGRNQLLTARTKRVVSECTTVAFALSILYFAAKSNFMEEENAISKVFSPIIKDKIVTPIKNFLLHN